MVQDVHDLVDLRFRRRQRWSEENGIACYATNRSCAGVGYQPAIEREIGEQSRYLPCRRERLLGLLVRYELEPDHHSLAAHIADCPVREQRLQLVQEVGTGLG